MMRSRFSRPRFLNAQNSYAAYLAVSALLDVLLESEGAFFKTTYLDFFGAYLDGHPLRIQKVPRRPSTSHFPCGGGTFAVGVVQV